MAYGSVNKEISVDMQTGRSKQNHTRPATPLQALMECVPGEEPDTSTIEMLLLRDTIADAIAKLSPRHRWVFEMSVMHRVPVRTLGLWMSLSKTYVWMLAEEAKAMLKLDLEDHPAIVAYLTRHDNTPT